MTYRIRQLLSRGNRRWLFFLVAAVTVTLTSLAGAEENLEALRASGDLKLQRRHVWDVTDRIMREISGARSAAFESWHGEHTSLTDDALADESGGIWGFSRAQSSKPEPLSGRMRGVPTIAYSLYNDAAYNHIHQYRLFSSTVLERLRRSGAEDTEIRGTRKIPDFPTNAMIIKTIWWPVAGTGLTPLPVWDPDSNPPNPAGNSYLSWRRLLVVDPTSTAEVSATSAVEFAGRYFTRVACVHLSAFHHVEVDHGLAVRMMRDPEASAVILLVLGRPLRAGDHLVLVAANLATREIHDWIWAALWWHDRASQGPFSADRPLAQSQPLTHYLMQTAWDAENPREADGSPHICFNPWLEGRFPNGGAVSNCLACHLRASYPPRSFLPPVRGLPRLTEDPAYAADTLRTSLLWALPLHAHP